MRRKVFFSFHFTDDVMRAAQVRNSNVISSGVVDANGFIDSVEWESIKRNSDVAIKGWINNQLENTSVTVVLIGSNTVDPNTRAVRKWIKYEIDRSIERGNGLIGIYIHNVNVPRGGLGFKGLSPFDVLNFRGTGVRLSARYRVYDWVTHDDRSNMGVWIEQAARDAGR